MRKTGTDTVLPQEAAKNKNIFILEMRKAKPKKRVILPDPVFGEVRVTKFVRSEEHTSELQSQR